MQLAMDGMSVFTFGISKAPKAVNELLAVTVYLLIPRELWLEMPQKLLC